MKIFTWLMVSSKDTEKLSLTVKGVLIGAVTYIVFFAGIFHFNVDQGDLNSLANQLADIVKMTLSLVSAVATTVGLIRKIYLSLTGKNKAL